MVEALAFNNYILTSNTCAAKDITNNEEVGEIFSIANESELIEKVTKIIKKEIDLKDKEYLINSYKNRFKYSSIIESLNLGDY